MFSILCVQTVLCQKLNGIYTWKTSGIETDSLVVEINILNDSSYIETTFIGKIYSKDDYKNWTTKVRQGKIVKRKKLYTFSEYENNTFIKSKIFEIKSNELRFCFVSKKTLKLMKTNSVYRKASL